MIVGIKEAYVHRKFEKEINKNTLKQDDFCFVWHTEYQMNNIDRDSQTNTKIIMICLY